MVAAGRKREGRGRPRRLARIAATALVALSAAPSVASAPSATAPSFAPFLAALWPDAEHEGVSRATFGSAFKGIAPDPSVIALAAAQPEFNQPVWAYLKAAVTPGRIAQGRALAATWRPWLDRIERRTGVSRDLVLAVWALESGYGRQTGGKGTLRSLATLACCTARRPDFFRNELLAALRIVQHGDVTAAGMTGSWAGAMGQTQFLPSSFDKDAVDADGDGKRDIWASVPDALASTANFLVQQGWDKDRGWGFEVELPAGFDYRDIDRHDWAPAREWLALGLKPADGRPVAHPDDPMQLLLAAGRHGPAFLIGRNYYAIKAYNISDAYVLAVGHLADRIGGAGDWVQPWPVGDRVLTTVERVALQQRLKALGYAVPVIDGKIGPDMRRTIRAWQASQGLVADGYATPDLLRRMGAE